MKIRPAAKEDLSTLDQCMQALLRFESRFDENLDPETVVTDNFAPFLAHEEAAVFVAEDGAEIIGYCAGFSFQEFGRKEPIAVLDAIYVREDHRRQGCGTGLIQAFFAFAREKGVKYIELKVLTENAAAYRLYTSLGFAEKEKKLRLPL